MPPRIVHRITDEFAIVAQHGTSALYLEWRENGRPRRRSTGCRSLPDALVAARTMILGMATVVETPAAQASIVCVLDRHYLLHASKLASASTFKATRRLWAEFWGSDTVADITPPRLRQFRAWLSARDLSDGYIRRVLGDGKAAFNAAYQDGELTSAPFIKLPPVAPGYPDYLRMPQLVRLLNTEMPEHLFTYLMIRLNTGCRGDAARDLQPFQIDWAAGLVQLNPPGRKQTKKFRPVVPMTAFLARYLRRLPASTYYVNYHGARVDSLRTAWAALLRRAGMPGAFPVKILRHTVGTELRRRGVPGWDVSGQMGHKKGESAPTTENYAKFDPAFLSSARDAIDTWMLELAEQVPRMRDASAMKPAGQCENGADRKVHAVQPLKVVGGTGFEPVTPTMSRCRIAPVVNHLDRQDTTDGDTE
jgi:integrase